MDAPLLETCTLTKEFGGLTAVDGVSITFDGDNLLSIIGPNGAGKTTFFNLITGSLLPTDGAILFQGDDITDLPMEEVARVGIVRSYQISELFMEMSVLENVRVAVQTDYDSYDFWSQIDANEEIDERAHRTLERVGLDHKSEDLAKTLSHGEQRTLEIAISLGADPELLLLDEPSSGMSPEEMSEIIHLIEELAGTQSIILIEHKMSFVRQVSDRIMVLHNGTKIAEGSPQEIQANEQVQRVYLGGEQL